jgi:hypothetical protein
MHTRGSPGGGVRQRAIGARGSCPPVQPPGLRLRERGHRRALPVALDRPSYSAERYGDGGISLYCALPAVKHPEGVPRVK